MKGAQWSEEYQQMLRLKPACLHEVFKNNLPNWQL